ncbi:hypothetical protein COOONC_06768 [Cooperia oncophora]
MIDMSLQDPISGKYKFDFDSDSSDEASSSGYAFNEEQASNEWDYFAERQARHKMMHESDSEDETQSGEPLDVRCKDLPPKFRPQGNQEELFGTQTTHSEVWAYIPSICSDLNFLQDNVARNLTSDPRHCIYTLRRIQQYMVPLVLNEFTFLAMGSMGAGKTSGYLLPLVNKLVELKEIEIRGRKGPAALIVTHTENKIKHIRELYNRYSRGTSLVKYFTTRGELDKSSYHSNLVADLICASAPVMVDAIHKHHVSSLPLKWVKFLVIEEFHLCTTDSEFMESLIALKKLLSANGASVSFLHPCECHSVNEIIIPAT